MKIQKPTNNKFEDAGVVESIFSVSLLIWPSMVLGVISDCLYLKHGHRKSFNGKQQNMSILALLLRRTSRLIREVMPKSVVTKRNMINIATCKQNARNAGIGTTAAIMNVDMVINDIMSIFDPVAFSTKPNCFLPIWPLYFCV